MKLVFSMEFGVTWLTHRLNSSPSSPVRLDVSYSFLNLTKSREQNTYSFVFIYCGYSVICFVTTMHVALKKSIKKSDSFALGNNI